MRESLGSICSLMLRSTSRFMACSLVSAELGIGTLRMSLENHKIFREHSDRGWSPAIVMKMYMLATTCSSLV